MIPRNWRTHWRTHGKRPARRPFKCGLENRFGPLGPTRVRIPPPPLSKLRVEIASIDGGRIRVRNLKAVNGTPIVDVKPALSGHISER